MRLLFLTQVLDESDGVLGFVVRWVEELAKHCEAVRVVALEVGDVEGLPSHVDWVEIGRHGRVRRYLRYRRALNQAMGAEGFDVVLAHMVPRYALMAAGPARRAEARLYLWYTHKGVDRRLRRAVPLTVKTFTASEESLRLEAPERVVTGHGIDTQRFDLEPAKAGDLISLLSVGRLTPAKDPLTLLRAVGLLVEGGWAVDLHWVGAGLTESDVDFEAVVKAEVARLGLAARVHFHGEVPYSQVAERFAACDFFVNASSTGSVDKVVLEAMAARRPALSCNDSFPPIFACLGDERADLLSFPFGDHKTLVKRLEALMQMDVQQRCALGEDLRAIVVRDHGVEALCQRLVREMQP